MKNHKVLGLLAGLAGLLAPASTQPADAPEEKPPGQAAEKPSAAEPPRADKNLRLNFRGAP